MERSAAFFLSPWARALAPLASIYGRVALARRRRVAARAVAVDVPVVSVGNVTVGGTGKTPVVELVVRKLTSLGRRPAILSRGYGRGREDFNDEYLVLRDRLPDTPHVQDPDRVAAARRALESGADALVLDDGFQHVRLRRDLDLVLIDATNPFGFGRMLPAGLLREPLSVLGEADILAITRGDLVRPEKLRVLRWYLGSRFPGVPRIEITFRPRSWRRLDGPVRDEPSAFEGAPAVAFAGIGNPGGFHRQLQRLGVHVTRWIPFPDHHRYTHDEIGRIDETARQLGARVVLTTQKDAVKLPWKADHGTLPWRYLEIEPAVTAGEDRLDRLLEEVAAGG